MHALRLDPPVTLEQRPGLDIGRTSVLALVCLCAGVAPLAARWIADDVTRIVYGLLVAALFLGFSLLARTSASMRQYAELSFAFFVLALVQVLNNSIPGYVGTYILRAAPNAGNPLASTVFGTLVIQLLGTALAVVPVVALTRLSGRELGSIYARTGAVGRWLVLAIVGFVVVYLFTATIPLRPGSFAERLFTTSGTVTFDRFVALSPALLVMVISNGFEEEFLFRGLFLQKYDAIFGARVSNVLQAAIFSIAHAGVTYTPVALLFLVAVVFPIGLVLGYLMRASNGVVAPGILHAGLDIPIYAAFLSYAM